MGVPGTFSISDLANELGITHRAIRHYEDLGLLSPQRQGLTRIYTAADRTRLKLIVRGKRLGLSLDESRQIIDMYEPGKNNAAQLLRLVDAIRQQRQKLQEQQQDINKLLKELDNAEAECQDALQNLATVNT